MRSDLYSIFKELLIEARDILGYTKIKQSPLTRNLAEEVGYCQDCRHNEYATGLKDVSDYQMKNKSILGPMTIESKQGIIRM